ncbi:MAG TPA: alpha/beta hydrolase [Tepidisphaeraceae bacterium]|nr:alpha/beta hydrolase [Tepidisphaeraceae bacterium]
MASVPTIVLLPGLHGTEDLFGPLLAAIPPKIRPRMITYPPDEALSYDALLNLLSEQLQSEQAMVLIAESFGGPLAIRFAAANPRRVRALVLVATFVKPPVPRWLRYLVHPVVFRVPPPSLVLRFLLLARTLSQPLPAELGRAIRKVRPHVIAHRIREVLKVDCTAELRTCSVPILYLAADRDRLVRPKCVKTLLRNRADVQVRTIEGSHMLLQVNPKAAWREIERFLAETFECAQNEEGV